MTDFDPPPSAPKTDAPLDARVVGRTPEQLTAILRKISQIAWLLAIAAALAALVIFRANFFAAPTTFAPPLITALPLEIEPSASLSVAPNQPHENALTPPPKIDWQNTPITGAIPGAYAVIYLAQQAVGIVVDGEYVRVYQPVKLSTAAIPTGDYFIAAREIAQNQMRLRLSYPSPADAQRFLAAERISEAEYREIAAAAERKKLPARLNPVFGAPLVIISEAPAAGRAISLPAAQLREFWTALPDGAPVMIR